MDWGDRELEERQNFPPRARIDRDYFARFICSERTLRTALGLRKRLIYFPRSTQPSTLEGQPFTANAHRCAHSATSQEVNSSPVRAWRQSLKAWTARPGSYFSLPARHIGLLTLVLLRLVQRRFRHETSTEPWDSKVQAN